MSWMMLITCLRVLMLSCIGLGNPTTVSVSLQHKHKHASLRLTGNEQLSGIKQTHFPSV